MRGHENLDKSLNLWGKKIQAHIRKYLRDNDFKASGKTIATTKYKLTEKDNSYNLTLISKTNKSRRTQQDVHVIDTIDTGQKKYFDRFVPIQNIIQWIKAKGIPVRRDSRSGRFVNRSENNIRRAAYAIATGIRKGVAGKSKGGTIKRYGYRGTQMYYNWLQQNQIRLYNTIGDAFTLDTTKQLDKVIIELNQYNKKKQKIEIKNGN